MATVFGQIPSNVDDSVAQGFLVDDLRLVEGLPDGTGL